MADMFRPGVAELLTSPTASAARSAQQKGRYGGGSERHPGETDQQGVRRSQRRRARRTRRHEVDVEGNVYCGGSGGIWIMDPSGKKPARIVHGQPANTNMAFWRR
jgi:hypothetical protein